MSGYASGAMFIFIFVATVSGWIAFDNAKENDQVVDVYLAIDDDLTAVPDNTIYTITIPEPETCIEIVVCGRLAE
jgi:hypothetical protein